MALFSAGNKEYIGVFIYKRLLACLYVSLELIVVAGLSAGGVFNLRLVFLQKEGH